MAEEVHSTPKRLPGGDDGLDPGACRANRSTPSAILDQTHWVTVGRLTPGLIHEINNILCVVGNHVQLLLLKNGGGNADVVKSLQVISDYTDRVQVLLHRFAKYAKPSERSSSRFRITDLLEEALALVHLQRPFRNLQLRKEFAEDLSNTRSESRAWIEGDPSAMMHVCTELLTIAASAIPGGGTLTICCQSICADSTGLDPGDSAGPAPGGVVVGFTGVGQWPHLSDRKLAVARTLVEQLGGRLTCEDDQATTGGISLTLPLRY